MAVVLPASAPGQAGNGLSGPWVTEQSGTTAGLRGIHAVNADVAWAGGTGGTILRTVDGGGTWQRCATPPNSAKLDFRAVWAWDAKTAIAMSSGPGDQSRLYKTTDGCASWKLLFTNPDKDGFWDAMVFGDRQDGMILGDPTLDDDPNRTGAHPRLEMTILTTSDGGTSWLREITPGMPLAGNGLVVPEGTGAFAASNSSLFLEDHQAWFGLGGTGGARVFIGDSYGLEPWPCGGCVLPRMLPKRIWFTHSVPAPLAGGTDSSGVFSLDWRKVGAPGYPSILVAVGGDYSMPNDSTGTAAWSIDGGNHWTASAHPPHGYRSAVEWDRLLGPWITVGTNGSDISYDDGKSWVPLDNGNWNALSLPWVVGPDGRIAKLDSGWLKK